MNRPHLNYFTLLRLQGGRPLSAEAERNVALREYAVDALGSELVRLVGEARLIDLGRLAYRHGDETARGAARRLCERPHSPGEARQLFGEVARPAREVRQCKT
jgi:hypothetical protein